MTGGKCVGKSPRRRGRLTPRIAPDLVSAVVQGLAPLPADESAEPNSGAPEGGEDAAQAVPLAPAKEANRIARGLAQTANSARMALHARTQRGQLAAWRREFDLSEDFLTARDELEHYAEQYIENLRTARTQIQPNVDALNERQNSKTSWSLPVDATAQRGVWAGRDHWIEITVQACAAARARDTKPLQCSVATARALISARADFFNPHGHACTAAAETIVSRAIERYGATITVATGLTRLRAINRVLADADLLRIHATGRYLTSLERLAARCHHGGVQKAAGSVVDANVPAHLLPHDDTHTDRPAYAEGLAERLAERDAAVAHTPQNQNPTDLQSSTYTGGYGLLFPSGDHGVAHARPQAGANTEISPDSTTISVRAWRIADDLTRSHTGDSLETGPYAHLTGSESAQMTLTSLARLIDAHTPSWAGTRDVLAGLVHSATSQATGYVGLGLSTRPAKAVAWMTTVLQRIDWHAVEDFPVWHKVSEAFGFHWCGNRRHWTNVG